MKFNSQGRPGPPGIRGILGSGGQNVSIEDKCAFAIVLRFFFHVLYLFRVKDVCHSI